MPRPRPAGVVMDRRQLLAAGAGAALGGCATAPRSGAADPGGDGASLAGLARRRGILFGTAVGPLIDTMPAYGAIVAADCSVIVPEYEMKWLHLAPTPVDYDFDAVDRRLAYALANGQAFRGHTLVWHQALPTWFDEVITADNAAERLARHIATVVGRYARKVDSWDVVNEAIDTGEPDGLRATPWRQLIGPDYIQQAFQAAASADPTALLVYNEYGLVEASPPADGKRQATLRLLERLLRRGVPIHALGLQCHLEVGAAGDYEPLGRFCREVAALGLEIMVTELDVADRLAPPGIAARDAAVAATYRAFLDCVVDQPATTAVLTWGLSDRHTWLQKYRPRPDGLPCRVLPYDAELRKKPAWSAIARSFAA